MILLALFCPPLYFFARGKIGMGIFSTLFAVLGIIFCLSAILLPAGLILWAIFAIVAVYYYKKEAIRQMSQSHAEMVGKEVAEQLKKQQPTLATTPPPQQSQAA